MTSLDLLPEGTYNEIERDWIDNEPPGLFPIGQDSLWGSARNVFTQYLQDLLADKLDQMYRNLDPDTVDATDMAAYEEERAIPVVTAKLLEARRAFLKARLRRGPFTRTRRAQMIEAFIIATFGEATLFSSSGIAFDAGGIPLFSGSGSLAGTYSVRDNSPYGRNLLTNPGFETDTSGWSVVSGTLVRSTAHAKWGLASGLFTPTNASGTVTTGATISGATSGRLFAASVYVMATFTGTKNIRFELHESGGANAEEVIATEDVKLASGKFFRLTIYGMVNRNDRTSVSLVISNALGNLNGIAVYVDGAQIEMTTGGTGVNKLLNADFELNLTDWQVAVSGGAALTMDRFDVTTFPPPDGGKNALRAQVTTAGDSGVHVGATRNIPVRAGKLHAFSVWIKGPVNGIAYLRKFENGRDEALADVAITYNGVITIQSHANVVLNGDWQRISGFFITDKTTATVSFRVMFSTTGTFYVDNAQLEEAKSGPQYPDHYTQLFEPPVISQGFVNPAKTPFYYEVRVLDTIDPDFGGLTRELKRITPSGITFDIIETPDV